MSFTQPPIALRPRNTDGLCLPSLFTASPQKTLSEILLRRVESAFDPLALATRCEAIESDYLKEYQDSVVWEASGDRYYIHLDRGSDVLLVAHLDTVQKPDSCLFDQEEQTVHAPTLDDRLGAYTILDLLPRLGITCDVLLCTDEERGRSSASLFNKSEIVKTKSYRYIAEFDRAGEDVVLYDFEDQRDLVSALVEAGFEKGFGSFSDISCLTDLGCGGFNIGVGYENYHSPRALAHIPVYFRQVARFLTFHEQVSGVSFPWEATEYAPSHYTDSDKGWMDTYQKYLTSKKARPLMDNPGFSGEDDVDLDGYCSGLLEYDPDESYELSELPQLGGDISLLLEQYDEWLYCVIGGVVRLTNALSEREYTLCPFTSRWIECP